VYYRITIQYDDGEVENTTYPDPDISLVPSPSLAKPANSSTPESVAGSSQTSASMKPCDRDVVLSLKKQTSKQGTHLYTVPAVGMRVTVRFSADKIYSGTINRVKAQRKRQQAAQVYYRITIQYDDGEVENTTYPDPDISLVPSPSLAKPANSSTPESVAGSSQTSASMKPCDRDVVLSLKDPTYKKVMFAKFQTLGARKGVDENNRIDGVTQELFSFFQQSMGSNGRFLKFRPLRGTFDVDEKCALAKIKRDLRMRNKSTKQWLKTSPSQNVQKVAPQVTTITEASVQGHQVPPSLGALRQTANKVRFDRKSNEMEAGPSSSRAAECIPIRKSPRLSTTIIEAKMSSAKRTRSEKKESQGVGMRASNEFKEGKKVCREFTQLVQPDNIKPLQKACQITPRFFTSKGESVQSLSPSLLAWVSLKGRKRKHEVTVTIKLGIPQSIDRKRKEIEGNTVSRQAAEIGPRRKSPRLQNTQFEPTKWHENKIFLCTKAADGKSGSCENSDAKNNNNRRKLTSNKTAKSVNAEYSVGYRFERFFQNAGWFKGKIVGVVGNKRHVKFDVGDKPFAIIATEEFDRCASLPKIGEIGFQFVRKFRGGGVFNGKVESITSSGMFVCHFEDGDIKRYSQNQMENLKSINYPSLMNMNEFGCKSGSTISDSNDSSDSEEETLMDLLQKKRRGNDNHDE